MKLWDKGFRTDEIISKYTSSNDRLMDMYLAEYDVIGTIAHVKMLCKIGLINENELSLLSCELLNILHEIRYGNFGIPPEAEDIHSYIEFLLTNKLGEIGKKVHSARSRNDQVLVDIRLFTRKKINSLVNNIEAFFNSLIELSEKNKDILMPGYTHLQVAMPSSFGLWFGAYAEALTDDLELILSAYKINNQNPLGSAAGYGTSFPIDRSYTTRLLGFENLTYNVVNAQMGRGKVERIVAFSIANLASTISKLCTDICLFMCQNFGFIGLPDDLTTGSSIMPHKKNPDIFEVTRAKCNKIQGIPETIAAITRNMPTGYFRDYQLIKEVYLPMFDEITEIVELLNYTVNKLVVTHNILDNKVYKHIFSVEKVNDLVMQGTTFRDAYRKVGCNLDDLSEYSFNNLNHTHEGSLGNLCNTEVTLKCRHIINAFEFEKYNAVINSLLDC